MVHQLLDDCAAQALVALVFAGAMCFGLLLDAIDAGRLAIELHECLASGVLDLEHAAGFADAHALLLREPVECTARLR